jgi:hypothetical protein
VTSCNFDESVAGTGRSAPPRGGRSRASLLLSRLHRPPRRRRARPCTCAPWACNSASPAGLPPLARPRHPRPLAASLGAAPPSPICQCSQAHPRRTLHRRRGLGARGRCGAGPAPAAPGVPAGSSALLPAAAGPFATAAPPCAIPAVPTRPRQPGHGVGRAHSATRVARACAGLMHHHSPVGSYAPWLVIAADVCRKVLTRLCPGAAAGPTGWTYEHVRAGHGRELVLVRTAQPPSPAHPCL